MQYSIFLKIYLTPHSGKNDSYNTPSLQNQNFLTLPNRYFSKIFNFPRHVEGGKMLAMQSIAKFGTVGMLNSWLM